MARPSTKIGTLLLSAIVFMSFAMPISSNRRTKRILGGENLPSMDTFKTYFNAQLRRSWACTYDQTEHNLTPCQEDGNRCGAALIHPEFVITAAQCLMYYEVHLRFKGREPNDWPDFPPDDDYDDFFDKPIRVKGRHGFRTNLAWEGAKRIWEAIVYFILPKPKHTVYSDWAIYVGSADAFTMTQKRHVVSVFPHSKFPILDVDDPSELKEFKEIQNSFHDVGLLRACAPFVVKHGEVELANMLRNSEGLQQQYDRIVNKGLVCLYIGFGRVTTDDFARSILANKYRVRGQYVPWKLNNKLIHTWRSSMCSSACNADRLSPGTKEHTCILCSTHHGTDIGVPTPTDYGGPVMCEGKLVSVITRSDSELQNNKSRTGSYPIHCVWNSIKNERLEFTSHYLLMATIR